MRKSAWQRTVDKRLIRTQNIDIITGEVLKGTMVLVPEKKKSAFGQNWFAMAQSALDFLASKRKILGAEGFAVFCKVVSKLDFENFIQINQAALARELSMSAPNFSRALKRLVDLGIIIRGRKDGVSRTYRLNPSVGWKGSAKNHFMALQVARAQGWLAIDKRPPEPCHKPEGGSITTPENRSSYTGRPNRGETVETLRLTPVSMSSPPSALKCENCYDQGFRCVFPDGYPLIVPVEGSTIVSISP